MTNAEETDQGVGKGPAYIGYGLDLTAGGASQAILALYGISQPWSTIVPLAVSTALFLTGEYWQPPGSQEGDRILTYTDIEGNTVGIWNQTIVIRDDTVIANNSFCEPPTWYFLAPIFE